MQSDPPVTARDLLDAVLDTYEDPARWTKNLLLRGADGLYTPLASQAVSCCVLGGLECAAHVFSARGDEVDRAVYAIRSSLRRRGEGLVSGFNSVSAFNDNPDTTIEDVRAVLREARDAI